MKRFILVWSLFSLSYAQIPSSFSLLVWNIHKAKDNNWSSNFIELSASQDLILVQEALMNETLGITLFQLEDFFYWELGKSFSYFGNDTGVLTLSRWPAFDSQLILSEDKEPITNTPKATLISFFELENSLNPLMVINTHGINFVGDQKFARNMEQIASQIEQHAGPLLWAGDFNVWNHPRLQIIKEIQQRLQLKKIDFAPHNIKTGPLPWAKIPLDYIFFRGLKVTSQEALSSVSSSDHTPLSANFTLSK